MPDKPDRNPTERLLERIADGLSEPGARPRPGVHQERTLEGYLLGQEPPAWMRRAAQIERLTRRHELRLRQAYDDLRERLEFGSDAFGERWVATVDAWDFREVNELIQAHNEWYPAERRLAVDPRTGDYVTVGGGRSYRRDPLGPEWALRRFPAR